MCETRRCSWVVLALLVAALPLLAACQEQIVASGEEAAAQHQGPATIEKIDGSEISRLTLTAKAAQRLDIQTAEVTEEPQTGKTAAMKVVPYSAVLYDATGAAWVYTNPSPLVFMRAGITIDRIEGEKVLVTDGPDRGTKVVTVGASLLYGTEFEVGED
jgi:hypothetical protein